MRRSPILPTTLVLALTTTPAFAVSVYKCEDGKGNVSYEAHCPPGTTPVDQKDYSAEGGTPEPGPRAGVTVYLVPNCDTCDQVKEFLSVRNIRPVEKNVATDVKLQEELKQRAGDLRVPVTIIGDSVVNGYNRTELLSALEAGGYAEGGGEENAEDEGAEETEETEEAAEEETVAEVPETEATEEAPEGE